MLRASMPKCRNPKSEIRINDETRMTKPSPRPSPGVPGEGVTLRASAFVIDSGFWFRHSGLLVVAVIDTGVDANHPDLAGHIVPGWNFPNNNDNTSPIAYHGTSVAGVIAATRNNGIGVAGVADVSIMPIIASDDPTGMSDLDAAIGIRWAADHGAKVINISAGLAQG